MTNENPVELVEAEKMLRGCGDGRRVKRSILAAFRSSLDVPRRPSVLGLVDR